jgi:hypothetical protein
VRFPDHLAAFTDRRLQSVEFAHDSLPLISRAGVLPSVGRSPIRAQHGDTARLARR